MKTLSILTTAALAALAAPAAAQTGDLGIGVYNYNPNASTAPQRHDWDWYWGKTPLQVATMTVGGQEYFDVGIANNGASEIPLGTTISAAFTLPTGMQYLAATPDWSCAVAPFNAQSVTCSRTLAAPLAPKKGLEPRFYLSVTIDPSIAEYAKLCATVSGLAANAIPADNSACANFGRYFAGRPSLWGAIDSGGTGSTYVNGESRTFTIRTGNEHGDPLRQGTRVRAVTGPLPAGFTNLAPPTSADPAQWNCAVSLGQGGQIVSCEKTLARDFMHGEGLGSIVVATNVVTTGYGEPKLSVTLDAIDARGIPVLLQRGLKYTTPPTGIIVKANP